jgi:hypothetical protein
MPATVLKLPVTITGIFATLRTAPANSTKYASRWIVLSRGASSPWSRLRPPIRLSGEIVWEGDLI